MQGYTAIHRADVELGAGWDHHVGEEETHLILAPASFVNEDNHDKAAWRPSFLSAPEAEEFIKNPQTLLPVCLADGAPDLSGRIFASADDTMEDGRIRAAQASPETSEHDHAELEDMRLEPIATASDPERIRSDLNKHNGSISAYSLEQGRPVSVAGAELALSGALKGDAAAVDAINDAAMSRTLPAGAEDISRIAMAVRTGLSSGFSENRQDVLALTSVERLYRELSSEKITPHVHADAMGKLE